MHWDSCSEGERMNGILNFYTSWDPSTLCLTIALGKSTTQGPAEVSDLRKCLDERFADQWNRGSIAHESGVSQHAVKQDTHPPHSPEIVGEWPSAIEGEWPTEPEPMRDQQEDYNVTRLDVAKPSSTRICLVKGGHWLAVFLTKPARHTLRKSSHIIASELGRHDCENFNRESIPWKSNI